MCGFVVFQEQDASSEEVTLGQPAATTVDPNQLSAEEARKVCSRTYARFRLAEEAWSYAPFGCLAATSVAQVASAPYIASL